MHLVLVLFVLFLIYLPLGFLSSPQILGGILFVAYLCLCLRVSPFFSFCVVVQAGGVVPMP